MSSHSNGSEFIGQTFNDFTVLSVAVKGRNGMSLNTRCVCGNECIVQLHRLLTGAKKSCGCRKVGQKPLRKGKDLTGRMFGELVVVGLHPERRELKNTSARQWICICSCGTKTLAVASNLIGGSKKSCGHLKNLAYNNKPGKFRTKVYSAWSSAINRCYNDTYAATEKYKGRGICMSAEFLNSFESFYEYIGDPPGPDYTLERIDVNGNYERGNIKWETITKQARNKTKLRNNTTGVTGVSFNSKDGCSRVIASWRELTTNGRTTLKNKSFSIKKYGLMEAFAMACAFRDNKSQELNSLGYGYSDNHGK